MEQTYWSTAARQGKIIISNWAKQILSAMSLRLWEEENASVLLGLRACSASEPNISLTKALLCMPNLAWLQLLTSRRQVPRFF